MSAAPCLSLECVFRSSCEVFAIQLTRLTFVSAKTKLSLDLASKMLRLTLCLVTYEVLEDLIRLDHPRSWQRILQRENTNVSSIFFFSRLLL